MLNKKLNLTRSLVCVIVELYYTSVQKFCFTQIIYDFIPGGHHHPFLAPVWFRSDKNLNILRRDRSIFGQKYIGIEKRNLNENKFKSISKKNWYCYVLRSQLHPVRILALGTWKYIHNLKNVVINERW